MKAAVISLGSVASQWTAQAMRKHFAAVDEINLRDIEVSLGGKTPEILYQGKPFGEYDCIYAKGSFRYANVLRAITTITGKKSYLPIKANAHTIGRDKLLTHLALQAENIPQPKTYVVATAASAKKILAKLTYPMVMKLPAGTHGKGVMLADSRESASSMIDALALLKQPFLIQEYVETGGTDVRAFVIGDEVVAAMERKAVRGEKRANIHVGGTGKATEIPDKAKKVAIASARALGADICGVDLLLSQKEPLVIEVNLSPGLQGITKATKIPMAEKVAQFLFDQAKKHKEEKEGLQKEAAKKEIAKELALGQEILEKLDFRGERVLLPKYVTKFAKLEEGMDVVIKIENGTITIEKVK